MGRRTLLLRCAMVSCLGCRVLWFLHASPRGEIVQAARQAEIRLLCHDSPASREGLAEMRIGRWARTRHDSDSVAPKARCNLSGWVGVRVW